jgi:hypothetical protein
MSVSEVSSTPIPTALPFDATTIQSTIMTYTIGAAIAIIVAIAIATLLLLRKRP